MSNMVEQVGRALVAAHYASGRGLAPAWEVLDRFERDRWLFSARAVIEAMRHYNFDMEQAGMKAMKDGEPFEIVWNTAINVALR